MNENTGCIIKPHYAGLFSLINKVITCAEIYPHWHVDYRGEGTIYTRPGEDLWGALFENNPPPVPNAVEINEYPHERYTYRNVAEYYLQASPKWRVEFNKLWRSLEVRPELVARAFGFAAEHFQNRKVIAALVRGHHNAGEQPSDRSQTLEEYEAEITKWYIRQKPRAAVYIVAGDLETVAWFQQNMRDVDLIFHPETKRAPHRGTDYHLTVQQTIADAEQVLIEVMLMSICDTLVHGVSNMSTGALYINPALKSVYLQ